MPFYPGNSLRGSGAGRLCSGVALCPDLWPDHGMVMLVSAAWWDYISALRPAGMSDRKLAAHIEVTPATVSRWRAGKPAAATEVVRAARCFGVSPVEALVAAGLLTDEETRLWRTGTFSLSDVSLSALLQELQVRLDRLAELDPDRSPDHKLNHRIAKGFLQ